MKEDRKYRYQDFWEMRGRQTIWVTRNFSYRVGAVVAYLASRMGVSPNMISVISAALTITAACLALYVGQGTVWAGVFLILGLQLGYAFDCADGPLARATGQETSFGSLSDKMADLSSGMILPCILAYGVGGIWLGDYDVSLGVIVLFLTFRTVLCVLMWLKEEVMYKTDRLREDTRKYNLWWHLKKAVSLYIDEPIYRFFIGLAWAVGMFWEFIVLYGLGVFVIMVLYILSAKKEMDTMDRESSYPL